ncbi:hypothetical protein Poly51_20610 [Rubripirellula tenax]|uniref:PcfJ-like protein n=1 Tax=Rubripirellula tenax TaxID=2528015 RepID=A0A5C6FGG7_9BACT|nr:PcfJ domain-containing protein [Rubripirellula tenax]TWU59274.1 hypothetical protein Poly51_20610 [Rubripirellula tenax]
MRTFDCIDLSRSVMGKRTKSSQAPQPSDKLLGHLASLGIPSIDEYRSWCAENGFGLGLNKPKQMLARERNYRRDAAIRERSLRVKRPSNKETMFAIALGRIKPSEVAGIAYRGMDEVVRTFGGGKGLTVLIEHLFAVRSKIVGESEQATRLVDGGATLIETLVMVAASQSDWLRPLADWRPRTHNAKRQMQSLLRHLFDRFGEVPLFMDHAWAITRDASGKPLAEGIRYRRCYVDMGRGRSRRKLDFPIALTNSMASYFRQAPSTLSIPQALRWSQVMGISSNSALAAEVMVSRLGDGFEHEEFWLTVLHWLSSQPMLDPVHVGPIIDYVHNRRFVPVHTFDDRNGMLSMTLAEPNLTMKGRTATSMLRQVDAWHRSLANSNRYQIASWKSSAIGGFEMTEGSIAGENLKIWTIRELLSSKSLTIEGRKLGHCVATYARSCSNGATSIWTMEVETFTGIEKRVTIEVRPATRQVVQVRGRHNRRMTEQEGGIIRRWCVQAGLTISKYAG